MSKTADPDDASTTVLSVRFLSMTFVCVSVYTCTCGLLFVLWNYCYRSLRGSHFLLMHVSKIGLIRYARVCTCLS